MDAWGTKHFAFAAPTAPKENLLQATAAASSSRTGFLHHPRLAIALLTPLVLLIHGYHPFADDGGVYVAGIRKMIAPALYQPDAAFVLAHTRASIFAHVVAALVRDLHLGLLPVLLTCHLVSIFLFLLGAWEVASRIFEAPVSRWSALILAASCFTLPVAGTALFVMDPYVTARSFSTPIGLFALAATLDESWGRVAIWLVLMTAIHPFMAVFTGIFLFALALAQRNRWRELAAFCGVGFLGSAVLFMAARNPSPESPFDQAALSRSYFFLSSWEWYEIAGVILPLSAFLLTAWRKRGESVAGKLSIAAAAVGSCALLSTLCFAHRSGSLLLARMQPLRIFHILYDVGILLLGGFLGYLAVQFRRNGLWALAVFYLVVPLALFASQRLTYPNSNHVEWPGAEPRNPWEQAFLWIRRNTPGNAIFAMDSDYIASHGEDSQCFRAAAIRSALADWYKDGGIASVFPAAADLWGREMQATEGLNRATDAERISRLRPFNAGWILLPSSAATRLSCPYANSMVRVCRLTALPEGTKGAK